MQFPSDRFWWARGAIGPARSLDARWLPLAGLGAVIVALILAEWRVEPLLEASAAVELPVSAGDLRQLPAVQVRLRADAAGRLAAIFFDGQRVRDAADLRARIVAFSGLPPRAMVEAQLDCDGNLRYEETERIVAAISRRPAADGRPGAPLVARVTFLRQK